MVNKIEVVLVILGILMLIGFAQIYKIEKLEVEQCTELCKTKMEHGVAVYTPIDGKCICEFSSEITAKTGRKDE